MRIEKRFAVQVMPSLRDEMNFVENDLGGMPEMIEARDRGDYQQRRNDDGVGGDPRRRNRRLFDLILDLPRHRESPDECDQRRGWPAPALQPHRAVVARNSQRDDVERRGRHCERVA